MTDAELLWKSCSETLSEQVSDATFRSSFEGIEPVSYADGRLVLAVPSTIVRDRLEGPYQSLIADAVAVHAGEAVTIDVQLKIHARPEEDDDDEVSEHPEADAWGSPARAPNATTPKAAQQVPAEVEPGEIDTPINPRYTFETFVIGGSNHFAHAAALAVAETPARSYNPLFIHGGAGLGKTHLLHAIGHYVHRHFPGRHVRYVSTETFMNEFIDAIRTNTQPHFKRRYRECDVLLVDDIQFLENKEGTQEEFFHTFNTIYGAGGQIVITCDRHAKALVTLEDRLRTRFLQGLITDVQPPDLETRLAILRKKADWEGITLPDDVSEYIATNIRTNIRELEGALVRLSAYSSLNRAPVTQALAEQVLGDIISPEQPRQITPKLILSTTAEAFGFSEEELMGASRRRPLVTARQICMYVFRELTDYSYPAIAREFGGRDHTTVIHAVEKIQGQMRERRQIYDQVTELISKIRKGA